MGDEDHHEPRVYGVETPTMIFFSSEFDKKKLHTFQMILSIKKMLSEKRNCHCQNDFTTKHFLLTIYFLLKII